jgi:uncharacterized protein (DUF1330 family)
MEKLRIVLASFAIAIAFGAVSSASAQTQSKPPVYVVAEVDVSDAAGFVKEYLPHAQTSIKESGGRFLAASQKITGLEGTPPKRVIITAWDSLEAAQAWFNSPTFKELRVVGDRYAKFRLFTVEGLSQ